MEGSDTMAFDGIITCAVRRELENNIIHSRVEKIYMPDKNTLIFSFHGNRKRMRLLISIDASNARFHFTNQVKENPAKASPFCMVLRKYIQGAKLIGIKQFGLDRVVSLEFENINELGDMVSYNLMVELMGKYSNIILVNHSNKILDSMRHVDFTMSSIREVLPARDYELPSTLDKGEFLTMDYDQFVATLQVAAMDPYFSIENMAKIMANQFVGFSKTFMQELFRYCSITDQFRNDNTNKLFQTIHMILQYIQSDMVKLTLYENDYHVDFKDFSTSNVATPMSDFLDDFYAQKEQKHVFQTSQFNLRKDVSSFIAKYQKNLKRVNEILEDAAQMEMYRLYGELISANIYRMKIGLKEIELENYYDQNNLVTIPLKENFSPSRNAQMYFKKYSKLKNSILYATKQKEDYEKNIDYLEDVMFLISEASCLDELEQIKLELSEAGYLKIASNKRRYYDEVALDPYSYTHNGITILVGRNNLQNDKLTLRDSRKTYTWLHTKDIHGSHVIIKSDSVPDDTLEYAAKLAVKHSQAKGSSKVPVDYTLVKYVHKPSGAKPGKVIYTNYKTILI